MERVYFIRISGVAMDTRLAIRLQERKILNCRRREVPNYLTEEKEMFEKFWGEIYVKLDIVSTLQLHVIKFMNLILRGRYEYKRITLCIK